MVRARWRGAILAVALSGSLASGPLVGEPPDAADSFRDPTRDGRFCAYCPLMITVPAGRFMLGSLPGEGHNDEHGPGRVPRAVDIRQGFSVGVSEITRLEFAAFARANPDWRPSAPCVGLVEGEFRVDADIDWRAPGFHQDDDDPVVCVSWDDATAYVQWLSALTGREYRLLSEAEWEYVARAGSLTRYWWGEWIEPNRANCLGSACGEDYPQTAPSRVFDANPFGLRNTLGNVWEWVQDCYLTDAYRRSGHPYPAPVAAIDDCKRVIRGGSWQENAWSLRAANRDAWKTSVPLNDIGFRVARAGQDRPL